METYLITTLKKNSIFFSRTLWVQVPQWNDDWPACSLPDTSCHWYIVQADNILVMDLIGKLPWYSIEGLQDMLIYDQTLESGHLYTMNTQDE